MNYPAYSKYRPSGINWLGDIPDEWGVWKISHLFNKIGSGTTPPSNNIDYYEGDVPWIVTGELNDNEIFDTENKVTGKAVQELSALKIFPKNSLLIAMYGATIGKMAILRISATTNQACCVLGDSKLIDIDFAFYYFLSFRPQLIALSCGGGQPNISQDTIKSIKIPLPTVKEQKEIVKFLDREKGKINQIIGENNRLVKLLQEKRQAVITRAVTKGLNPKAKMKPSGVNWLGDIPEAWGIKKLKYIGKAIIGLTYSPSEITDEKGTLVLRASNIRNNKIDLNDNVYVNTKIPPTLITKFGDILLCARSGSKKLIGKNAFIDKSCVGYTFGAFMTIFRSQHWKFLSYVFNSTIFSSQSELFITSTINQLTMDSLNNIIVALPSSNEQKNIVEFLNKETSYYDEAVKKLQLKNQKLQEYRQALISSAVTGKIRVD